MLKVFYPDDDRESVEVTAQATCKNVNTASEDALHSQQQIEIGERLA